MVPRTCTAHTGSTEQRLGTVFPEPWRQPTKNNIYLHIHMGPEDSRTESHSQDRNRLLARAETHTLRRRHTPWLLTTTTMRGMTMQPIYYDI